MRKGLVIVNTGNGKGKTTAALGILFRAYGRGFRSCVIQFLKAEESKTGEHLAAQKLGIEWHCCGDGFVFDSEKAPTSAELAIAGWDLAKEKIVSNSYDLIILDEFVYPLSFRWLDCDDVISWLKANKPPELHLIITGRNAPRKLVAYADLVTEMKEIKHPFNDQKLPAQPGIDF